MSLRECIIQNNNVKERNLANIKNGVVSLKAPAMSNLQQEYQCHDDSCRKFLPMVNL